MRHAWAAAGFAAFGVAWSFPLVARLSSHVPGQGAGDNLSFVWNFWWMRTAIASGQDPFHTPYLFAPVGADLTLHTHTALPASLGATVLGSLPVVTALNLTIILALALNGFCAYLLAWRVTGDRGAAAIGGLVFGGSPYVAGHLNGHFNLTTAWMLPLFAIAALEMTKGSRWWAVLAGLMLGVTAYVDYYYVVYELALALCVAVLAGRRWSVAARPPGPWTRRAARIVGILIVINALVIVAISLTGGVSARIGWLRASMRGLFNPLQVFWALLALWLWLRFHPRVTATPVEGRPRLSVPFLAMTGVFLAVAAPIVWHALRLVIGGEYVTQEYFWRNAPKGIDLATMFLGNPFHGLWGESLQRAYRFFSIDAIESTAWLGLAPVLLAAVALRRGWRDRPDPRSSAAVRMWTVIGVVFFVWALGPHLVAFGVNTGMILPEVLLRYVPFASNARIPGRAIVMTYLAIAMLASIATAAWRPARARRSVALVAIGLAVIADFLPAPFPLVALDRPALYETLRDRAEAGAVCELPFGIRDGFGERGALDHRAFFYQTIHQRPVVGGFVARLPRSVAVAYERDPLLNALLKLSGPDPDAGREGKAPLPDARVAAERLRENGIAFVVFNRHRASARLTEYVKRVLPLALIAGDDERELYVVVR